MIPEWLKNDSEIYNRHKNLINIFGDYYTGIDDFRDRYHKFIEDGTTVKSYPAFPRHWYVDIQSGIEIDNNNLKPISIIIGNWERYYYIPFLLEMWYNQDYPKNLMEIIIVDGNSVDKMSVLNTIKEQTKLYPDLKIRFIQDYINKCHNPNKRVNIGTKYSSHNIIIISESDMIPLGKNYLRGICHAHNKFPNVSCTGIVIFIGPSGEMEYNYSDLGQIFNFGSNVSHMTAAHLYCISFNKELYSKIRGHDEVYVGYGGQDTNILRRYTEVGGKYAINTSIYCGSLVNFPRPLPPDTIRRYTGAWFQEGTIINNENWGISEKMEEINLYS